MNTALAWSLTKNPQSYWSKILTNKYNQNTTNLNIPIQEVSRTWKCVIKGLRICREASLWIIHKGDKVNFLFDKYFPSTEPLKNIIHGPHA